MTPRTTANEMATIDDWTSATLLRMFTGGS
jgi:hypothetical protein